MSTGKSVNSKRPTLAEGKRLIAEFDQQYGEIESAIQSLCDHFPRHDQFTDVLLKVSTINQLYSTNIYDVEGVARNITNTHVGSRIADGDLSVVADIASVKLGGKTKCFLSFASKYCSWHCPEKYCIYDSYVDEALWVFKQDFSFAQFKRADLRDYGRFMELVGDFSVFFGLSELSLKDLDKYLWLLGRGMKAK